MENEITDLQQRLDFSKHEQQEDVWCRSWGFNKLLLATGLLFYFSPRQLVLMSVHLCVYCDASEAAALIVLTVLS